MPLNTTWWPASCDVLVIVAQVSLSLAKELSCSATHVAIMVSFPNQHAHGCSFTDYNNFVDRQELCNTPYILRTDI